MNDLQRRLFESIKFQIENSDEPYAYVGVGRYKDYTMSTVKSLINKNLIRLIDRDKNGICKVVLV